MLSGELHPHTPSLRWKKVLGHEGISGASSHPPSCADLLPDHLLSSLRRCQDHRQGKAGQRSQALSHSPQSHSQVRSEPRALAPLRSASRPLPVSPPAASAPQALSKPPPNTPGSGAQGQTQESDSGSQWPAAQQDLRGPSHLLQLGSSSVT